MTKPAAYDPRVTAVRPDLAAASLRGRIEAEHYVDGERYVVDVELLDLKRGPRPDATLDTQLLFGEMVTVFEDKDGWGWIQAERDDYVGYVAMSGLSHEAALDRRTAPPTHRVIVNRTFVYPAADMKRPVLAALPLGASLAVEERHGAFVKIRQGYVVANHLAPHDRYAPDYVAVAEQLLGSPYLWGGASAQGVDCSGLVQLSRALAGQRMPRDTHMQERVGVAVPFDDRLGGLTRGDLVFWQGHVGIMLDETMLLHANAHQMLVARESLVVARDRIAATSATPISSIRRVAVE